jgi:hypothetical protein
MSYVIKVSQEGYNVLDTEEKNLSFNSEKASHAIYQVYSATRNSGDGSVTVNHNLGYVPKVWVFLEVIDGAETYLRRIPILDDVNGSVDYYITSSDVVIQTEYTTGTLNFKVVVFTRSPNV